MSSATSDLSVIVPVTRLGGKEQNLRSWLLKLPRENVAVFLVHDVQDIITSEILSSILSEARNPNIQMFEATLNSPGLTRNVAIDCIASEWTWFVDADDLPLISEALVIIKEANHHTEVIIGRYGIRSVDGKSRAQPEIPPQTLESVAYTPGIWRMIFRSRSIGDIRFKSFRMGEDQLFLLEYGIFHRKIQFVERQIYTYFLHVEGQLTSRRKDILEISKVISRTLEIFRKSNLDEKNLVGVMFLRQVITLAKNLNLKKLPQLLHKGLKIVLKFEPNELVILLKSFLIIGKLKWKSNG